MKNFKFAATLGWNCLFVLFLSAVCNKAGAVCSAKTEYGADCYTWQNSGSCGEGCTYTYNNGTVYVKTAESGGTMKYGAFYAANYEDGDLPVINNVVIDGPINMGQHALIGQTVSGKDGALVITGSGWNPLMGSTINSDIIFPEGASLGYSIAFLNGTIMNGKIYCAIPNCVQALKNSCYQGGDSDSVWCLNYMESLASDPSKFEQAPAGCAMYSASGCLSCSSGYRDDNGTCVMKTCDDYGELSVCEDSVSGCTKQVCTAGTTLADGTSCYVQQPQSIAPSCGENAHLVDNESTCKCVCNSGYTGDGATCVAINCAAGEYWNGEQCAACNEGEYSAGGFVTECSANTAEHCASKSNTANVCASCAANYFMDGTTCTAINCSAGEFFDMSAKVCTPCVEGEWNDVAAATSCMPNTAANCASKSKTANVCASCAAKFKFADNECVMMTCAEVYPDSSETQCETTTSGCSVTTCSEVGSLADGTKCYKASTSDHTPNCDSNATLTGEGAECACVCNTGFEGSGTSCTAISCPAGKYLDGSECKPCAAGSYAAAGDNVCSSCGAHEYSAAGASSCSPRNNMSNCSSFATDSDECTSCKTGYKSENGGCVSLCSGGKVYWDGECYDEYPFAKKRYTPAEADQWLKDDGNIVTLIFKK